LHVGIRNTVGILTDDAFTQTNPPQVTGAGTISQSAGFFSNVLGLMGGSVAFTRGDIGPNYVGGPTAVGVAGVRPLGVFINNAAGRPYENLPGPASGIGPYVSGMGTYGNSLYETQNLVGGADLNYTTGDPLFASQNGYLTNVDANNNRLEQANATLMGYLKMPADSVQPEIVYDQRI
jgi:hypothetical protein